MRVLNVHWKSFDPSVYRPTFVLISTGCAGKLPA
jgi:hypothetical protein